MNSIIDSDEQAKVINAPVGDDLLVVAGAGSGKTYTMTRRIINLIQRGVAPERILGLTFTRKAAGELSERVAAAVLDGRNRGEDAMFLKPSVYTYDAFFQTIVRQYGLLVGFDQNTQPLSAAGAMQLANDVIDRHLNEYLSMDDGEIGSLRSLASGTLELSNAINSAMIGGDCVSVDEAIERIRRWDEAFIERVRRAIGDETMPDGERCVKIPVRKDDTKEETWRKNLDKVRDKLHQNCVFHCGQLITTAERRELLLNLVADYTAEKRRLNMAEFGDFTVAKSMSKFFDMLDSRDKLTRTIIYNLNPRDNELVATMLGNFQDGRYGAGKIQFGSGWWFLDQKDGMEKQMNALSTLGLLSRFVGMLTDSRSFLSYPRHEYFRRTLCNLLGNDIEQGLLPASEIDFIGREIVEGICYRNAKNFFKF